MRTHLKLTFLSLLFCGVVASAISPAQSQGVSWSAETDSGYLLREPAVLVTNKPVGQLNAYVPLGDVFYFDEWYSHRLDQMGFLNVPGDELDTSFGCNKALSQTWAFSCFVSWYAIAGSHNDREVAKARFTHDFGSVKAYGELEFQHVATGQTVGIAHFGADHTFTIAGTEIHHEPEVSLFDGGYKTFADTVSVKVHAFGVAMSPHAVVSIPSTGGTQAIVGVSFNLN